MIDKPLVTFVMPSCRDDHLEEAINSIKNQTMPQWELILYDNSDKERIKHITNYKYLMDERIRITQGFANRPVIDCYNTAKERAKSDIIIIAHDDDISMPERSQIILDYFNNTNCDLFYSSYIGIDNYGKGILNFDAKKIIYNEIRSNKQSLPFPTFAYLKDKAPDFRNIKTLYDWTFLWDCLQEKLNISFTITPTIKYRMWQGSDTNKIDRPNNVEEDNQIVRNLYNDQSLRTFKRERIILNAKHEFYKNKNNKGFNISRRKMWLAETLNKILTRKDNTLDIGCGDGFLTTILSLYTNIMGVDLSVSQINKTKVKFHDFNIETEDIKILPQPDIILLLDVIEHINAENESKVLDKIFDYAKDQVIISFPLDNVNGTQIVDRNVDDGFICKFGIDKGYSIINKQFYTDNPKEKYILLQFKRNK